MQDGDKIEQRWVEWRESVCQGEERYGENNKAGKGILQGVEGRVLDRVVRSAILD